MKIQSKTRMELSWKFRRTSSPQVCFVSEYLLIQSFPQLWRRFLCRASLLFWRGR